MSAVFRIVPTLYDKDGHPYCQSVMSPKENMVRAKCILPPDKVIPVIFVPGIMGSNLGTRNTKANKAGIAWYPDSKSWAWEFKGLIANQRQVILDPAQTYVASLSEIPDGESPFFAQAPKAARKNWKAEYLRRGWGTVMLSSYGPLLYHLEFQLNRIYQTGTIAQPWRDLLQSQGKQWGEMQGYSKLEESELFKAGDYWYPVHAVGYNWLQSNGEAGKYLAKQINAFTSHYRKLGYPCEKVILVTHSMGGLVARAAAHPGMGGAGDKILGIVHGVQPATGAATAYKRVRAGFESSLKPVDYFTAKTLGWSGEEVTAVFANSPGALQLLPSKLYPKGWLRANVQRRSSAADALVLPKTDPYEEIYRVKDKWWRLVDPALIDPAKTIAKALKNPWGEYLKNLNKAESFHDDLHDFYHASTWVHYGADPKHKAWGQVCWRSLSSSSLITAEDLPDARLRNDDRLGTLVLQGPLAKQKPAGTYDPWWNHIIDHPGSDGDGTVPHESGSAPAGKVKFIAKMTGFDHQGSYQNLNVQTLTLYCVVKIVQEAA